MPDRKQSFRTAPPLETPNAEQVREIVVALLSWGPVRLFPWRRDKISAFHVLLAEVLLTRTRAESVAVVIERLWSRYPGPRCLADASIEEIEQIIEPLGLRKRAGMLRACANEIVKLRGVPTDRKALMRLPGVGSYVVDAVRVVAFDQAVIPVDAGIGRVLRRVLGYPTFGPAYADRALWDRAQRFADPGKSRNTTFALLDVGALICLPERPTCNHCPLSRLCAYNSQSTGSYEGKHDSNGTGNQAALVVKPD